MNNSGAERMTPERLSVLPGMLTKEEIKKVIKVVPCLGLRFEPEAVAKNEMENGVEQGDYLKISRPKFLDNENFIIKRL